jgi:hypothetical protein
MQLLVTEQLQAAEYPDVSKGTTMVQVVEYPVISKVNPTV